MCVLFFAHGVHPTHRLVLAANRDEAHARPTAAAARWPGSTRLVAGRDLEGGGTWLGVGPGGRWAALTNIRDLPAHREGTTSRGRLVADFLTGQAPPPAYAADVHRQREAFNPFNLVVGDALEVWYVSTRRAAPEPLVPGVYGLSNDVLDTPWPKVRRGRAAFEAALADDPVDPERLLALLADETGAPDADLPDTGVGLALERTLAPLLIRGVAYGTRSSTVVRIGRDGTGSLVEQSWGPGAVAGTRATVAVGG